MKPVDSARNRSIAETRLPILGVELVYDLEKLPVISGFDASNLSSNLRNKFFPRFFYVDCVQSIISTWSHGRADDIAFAKTRILSP